MLDAEKRSWNVTDRESVAAPEPRDTGARIVPWSPSSLHGFVDAVGTAGLTLTLCNYGEGDDVRDELDAYFGRLNVAVRTADLSTETPANVAILHRESAVLATSPVSELYAAVSLEALDSEDVLTVAQPDVLAHVHRNQYTVEEGTKLELVRISRLIAMRALGTGHGTLHTGFQRLDRIDDELDTRDVYERIAREAVSVHLYGRQGEVPNAEWYTLHTAEVGEIADSWFVVYDGGELDSRKGALCARRSNRSVTPASGPTSRGPSTP